MYEILSPGKNFVSTDETNPVEDNASITDLQNKSVVTRDGVAFNILEKILAKIPYFQSLFLGDSNNAIDSLRRHVLLPEAENVYLRPIIFYLKYDNLFYMFGKVSSKASVDRLFELFDFLMVTVPQLDLDEGEMQMKTSQYVRSRRIARSAAAEIIFSLGHHQYNLVPNKIDNQLFQLIEFIVSHHQIFGFRLRQHAKTVACNKFTVSKKITAISRGWIAKFPYRKKCAKIETQSDRSNSTIRESGLDSFFHYDYYYDYNDLNTKIYDDLYDSCDYSDHDFYDFSDYDSYDSYDSDYEYYDYDPQGSHKILGPKNS